MERIINMCNCIDEVQKKLLESGSNTMLDIPMSFSPSGITANRVTISTCKREDKKRGKPKRVFGAYCPFCGLPYPEE